MTILSKAEDALARASAITLRNGNSTANQNALARLKEDVRGIIAEATPAPEPEPTPPVTDLRPWITPIETDMTFGAKGRQTTLKDGQRVEGAALAGMLIVPKGVTATLAFCKGDGGTGIGAEGSYVSNQGGHLILDHCEFTGCDGRAAVYQKTGTMTPAECWFHDNGAGLGVLFQQLYLGGGQIIGGKGSLIENGPGYGFQCYSPPNSTYPEPVTGVEWDGLEVTGFTAKGGIVLGERVENATLTNLNVHGNAIGVRAYGALANIALAGHVWGNSVNLEVPSSVRQNIVTTAP